MSTPVLIILAILLLSVLIIIHEFGHYIAAKLSGVWVEEFGIGLPPKAWGKKIGETIYSINWLPIGGFVRLHGESADMKVTDPKRAFSNKSKAVRAFIAVNGIIMNFILAFVIFTLMFVITGIPKGVKVIEVLEKSPGYMGGIKTGDIITGINNSTIVGVEEFLMGIADHKGKRMDFNVKRGEESLTIPVDVRNEAPEGEGLTGIGYDPFPAEVYRPGIAAPIEYSYYGARETVKWTKITVNALASLFRDISKGKVPQGLAGPLGVTLTIAEFIKYGIVVVLSFTGIISVNLALLNILPIPPLDGSRVMLLGAEYVVGKARVQKYESKILTAGFVFMLGLLILITASEIPKILSAHSLSGFVESLFQQ